MHHFDPIRVLTAATELVLPVLDDLNAAPEPGKPYERLPILKGSGFDLILCQWAPDAFCLPHDCQGSGIQVHPGSGQAGPPEGAWKSSGGRLEDWG